MTSKWSKLFPAATRNKADFLLDGDAYYESVIQAIETTKTDKADQHYIYILGWMLDVNFQLVNGDKDKTLFKLLESATKHGVEVRMLIWDNIIVDYFKLHREAIPRLNNLQGTKAFLDSYTFFPQKSKQLLEIILSPIEVMVNLYGRSLLQRYLDQNVSVNGIPLAMLTRLREMMNSKSLGAHHEKVVIVKGKDGLIAYCGGIDFNKGRVISEVKEQEIRFPSLHDTACRLQGPAAYELLQRFKRRWHNHPIANKTEKLRGEDEAKPEESKALCTYAKVVHTYNGPDGKEKVRSLSHAYLKIIENAERYIYIEDQYIVNLDVAHALNKRIKYSQFERLILATQASHFASDIAIPNRKRGEFLDAVLSGTTDAQKEKVLFAIIDPLYSDREQYHPGMHAKTLIVDDEIAIIGSANVNQRSFTVDSETSVIVFDDSAKVNQNFARKFRIQTWKHFLRRKVVPLIYYESWQNYPTLIRNWLSRGFSILIEYDPKIQEDDLDVKLKKRINSLDSPLRFASHIFSTSYPDPIDVTYITIDFIFNTLWDHFIDPKAD